MLGTFNPNTMLNK